MTTSKLESHIVGHDYWHPILPMLGRLPRVRTTPDEAGECHRIVHPARCHSARRDKSWSRLKSNSTGRDKLARNLLIPVQVQRIGDPRLACEFVAETLQSAKPPHTIVPCIHERARPSHRGKGSTSFKFNGFTSGLKGPMPMAVLVKHIQ